jgi:hypothetical protein
MRRAQALRENRTRPLSLHGTRIATPARMAAVFALIFLFAFAAVLIMVMTLGGDTSTGVLLARFVFIALSAGVFLALYKMMRRWEDEKL